MKYQIPNTNHLPLLRAADTSSLLTLTWPQVSRLFPPISFKPLSISADQQTKLSSRSSNVVIGQAARSHQPPSQLKHTYSLLRHSVLFRVQSSTSPSPSPSSSVCHTRPVFSRGEKKRKRRSDSPTRSCPLTPIKPSNTQTTLHSS